MIPVAIDDITADHIRALVTNGVREGRTIEYKQSLPGATDSEKKEFLADVSSFANASGGDLVYGMDATEGVPTGAIGLQGATLDQEMLRLEGMIRDAIAPRILGLRMKPIAGLDSGPALLLRIPRSWSGPHMVTFKGSSRFFTRSSAGKVQMDVDELRSAFALAGDLPKRIRSWRDERLSRILANETPIPLHDPSLLVLHLVPVQSLHSAPTLAVIDLVSKSGQLGPIGVGGGNRRVNLDGLAMCAESHDRRLRFAGYAQTFRSGCIESVFSGFAQSDGKGGPPSIPSQAYEKWTLEAVAGYIRALNELSIGFPMVVMLSMMGVKGAVFAVERGMDARPQPLDRDPLLLPEIIIEEAPRDLPRLMRPMFDAAWNAGGLYHSFNYDGKSNWKAGSLTGVPMEVIK